MDDLLAALKEQLERREVACKIKVDMNGASQIIVYLYINCLYMIYGAIPPILNRLQAYPLFGSKTDIIHI